MEFIKFAGHCLLEGWEVGHYAFLSIEAFCAIVTIILSIRMRSRKGRGKHAGNKQWEKAEGWIMKGALAMFLVLFVCVPFLYVPYVHHKDAEARSSGLTNLV